MQPNQHTPHHDIDEHQPLDDVPSSQRIRIRRPRPPQPALGWAELERVSAARFWGPVCDLPATYGDEELDPQPPHPLRDRYDA